MMVTGGSRFGSPGCTAQPSQFSMSMCVVVRRRFSSFPLLPPRLAPSTQSRVRFALAARWPVWPRRRTDAMREGDKFVACLTFTPAGRWYGHAAWPHRPHASKHFIFGHCGTSIFAPETCTTTNIVIFPLLRCIRSAHHTGHPLASHRTVFNAFILSSYCHRSRPLPQPFDRPLGEQNPLQQNAVATM